MFEIVTSFFIPARFDKSLLSCTLKLSYRISPHFKSAAKMPIAEYMLGVVTS